MRTVLYAASLILFWLQISLLAPLLGFLTICLSESICKHFFIFKTFLLLGTTYTPVLVLRYFFLCSFGLSFEPKLDMKSADLFFS